MNDTIITAVAGIFTAALTFYFTKKHELDVQWRNEKMNHYKVLLSAISDLASDRTDKSDADKRLSLAVNTIVLASPQYVIDALMAYYDEIKDSNQNKSPEQHDILLKKLALAIRKDIGLSKGDNSETFNFRLIG